MENINRIELRGIVGSVMQNTTLSGIKLIRFSVATNYMFRNSEGMAQIETTWFTVNAFESDKITAETINRISKNSRVHLYGRLRNNKYTDANGIVRYQCEVMASNVEVLPDDTILQYQTDEV